MYSVFKFSKLSFFFFFSQQLICLSKSPSKGCTLNQFVCPLRLFYAIDPSLFFVLKNLLGEVMKSLVLQAFLHSRLDDQIVMMSYKILFCPLTLLYQVVRPRGLICFRFCFLARIPHSCYQRAYIYIFFDMKDFF